MGEEYIRVIPSPNFPSKTQRCSSRPYHNARTSPVNGGRRPVSAFGNINTLPGAKTDPRASQAAPAQSTSNGGGLPPDRTHSLTEAPGSPPARSDTSKI